MDDLQYMGPRPPTEAERSQLDELGYGQDIVLVEFREVSGDWHAFVPVPRALFETDEQGVLNETWPRVLNGYARRFET